MPEEERFIRQPKTIEALPSETPTSIPKKNELVKDLDRNIDRPTLEEIYRLSEKITAIRKIPLLIIFYPEDCPDTVMIDEDVIDVQKELEQSGLVWGKKEIEKLDVVMHTLGGSPTAAYLMIQAIHDFAKDVNLLVPYFSYSGGTLFSLGSSEIRLGAQAVLSPIDVHYVMKEGLNKEFLGLIDINYFVRFAGECREIIETHIEDFMKSSKSQRELSTKVEEILLKALVEQNGAVNLGRVHRERVLTAHYADKLLRSYMLKDDPDKKENVNSIVQTLVFECPSHSFKIDFHIAKSMGLSVVEMDATESKASQELINYLRQKREIICRYRSLGARFPFIKLIR